MERGLKERLVGAAVLVALAVVFIPMLLDDSSHEPGPLTDSNIPERPQGENGFSSRIMPAEPEPVDIPPPPEPAVPEGAGEPVIPPPEPEAPPESAPSAGEDGGPRTHDDAGDQTGAAPEVTAQPEPRPEAAAEPEKAPATKEPAAKAVPKPDTDPAVDAPAPDTDTRPQADGKPSGWVVQLGSFAQEENARTLDERLRAAGYASFVEPVTQGGKTVYRVRVGPEVKRSEAEKILSRIADQFELKGIVVSYP